MSIAVVRGVAVVVVRAVVIGRWLYIAARLTWAVVIGAPVTWLYIVAVVPGAPVRLPGATVRLPPVVDVATPVARPPLTLPPLPFPDV